MNIVEGGEHGNRGAQSTHGDFCVAADFEEPARIELQNFFDGERIFAAGSGVVFVVIEVGSSQQQHIRFESENFSECFSDGYQRCVIMGAECNGNKRELRLENLQERKLHFK